MVRMGAVDQLRYGMSIKLYGEDKAFGPGIAELLRNVEKEGSLQGAAQSMNMAYSKAWRIIKDTEAALDLQLLNRDGAHGSDLTEAGNKLLDTYLAIEEKLQKEAEELFEAAFK